MKIRLTHMFNDRQRMAVARDLGREGLASREQCVQFLTTLIDEDLRRRLANMSIFERSA